MGTLEERFWNKVDKRSLEECWPWLGGTRKGLYGAIRTGGSGSNTRDAHRVSWEIHFGKILHNLFVLHKCDNPSCVNPNHLFLGTQKDNVKDMHSKGRNKITPLIGAKNGMTKLSDDEVRQIRKSGSSLSLRKTATEFGVSARQIHQILKGTRRNHVK